MSGGSHAFVYIDGKMWDLNDLIQPNSGWRLDWATGINDFGQIVGNGRFLDASRSFRLDPVHTYTLRLLYDSTTAKGSANFTVKVQLLDRFGATSRRRPSLCARSASSRRDRGPEPSRRRARPNPGNEFQYDSKLGKLHPRLSGEVTASWGLQAHAESWQRPVPLSPAIHNEVACWTRTV